MENKPEFALYPAEAGAEKIAHTPAEPVREYMQDTTFLIQPDRDTFADLVANTDYPAFASDRIIAEDYRMEGRVFIPIDEEKARYTFYIACRTVDKKKYAAFFNSVRSEVIGR